MSVDATTGVVLFAHGARDAAWAAPFERVRDEVAARIAPVPVLLSYLELMTPDLETATAALVDAGRTRVVVVPLFLGQGSHLRRDLPERIAALKARWPDVTLDVAGAAGEDDAVLAAMADYCVRASGAD